VKIMYPNVEQIVVVSQFCSNMCQLDWLKILQHMNKYCYYQAQLVTYGEQQQLAWRLNLPN
jgi:hypothetical protein